MSGAEYQGFSPYKSDWDLLLRQRSYDNEKTYHNPVRAPAQTLCPKYTCCSLNGTSGRTEHSLIQSTKMCYMYRWRCDQVSKDPRSIGANRAQPLQGSLSALV
jgi:hypothetical protein